MGSLEAQAAWNCGDDGGDGEAATAGDAYASGLVVSFPSLGCELDMFADTQDNSAVEPSQTNFGSVNPSMQQTTHTTGGVSPLSHGRSSSSDGQGAYKPQYKDVR